MHATLDMLPSYLRQYLVATPGAKYTPRDQAAWRYIMRQARAFFKDHAVPVYAEGLARTGITVDRIPLISDIDAKLNELGWGAVPVCGFIPPAAFLDFQARRILPIATDMRSVEHIAYTPAPDIVHEAAGHAPIIADPEYAEYLTMYAEVAQKAIFCQEDLDLYEAIRTLSDVKENPDSTPAVIAAAEAALTRATAAVPYASEATKVARMNWWTVEYGLLGPLARPRIYGAGLLSSVAESQACLTAKVAKLRLSLACVETSYNITEPQPQLFVADDIPHLKQVLKELEATLSYKHGGAAGLREAQRGRTVTTAVLDSGIAISGRLDQVLAGAGGAPEFLRYGGPVQLTTGGRQLAGQGVAEHAAGFSSPLGRAARQPATPLASLTDAALSDLGLRAGERATLELTTGFRIAGLLVRAGRQDGQLVLLTWRDCRVTRGSELYYQPDWGDFDMTVGERVVSVYGGPADREAYGARDLGTASTTPGRTSPFTLDEQRAFAAYADIRRQRDEGPAGSGAVALAERLAREFPNEWLLRLEALELAAPAGAAALTPLLAVLRRDAEHLGATVSWLVRQGEALLATSD